jgi:uncharacterized protein (TIGR02597 family)
MNPSKLFHLSAAALCTLAVSASAQTTATTIPAGFITKTIPAAVSATTPSNVALSIPLYKAASFVGAVSSVDNTTTVALGGAAFTTGQFNFSTTTQPYLLRVKTGSAVGRFFLISTNTATQVTVDLTGTNIADIGTVAPVGTQCEVVASNTLGNVFGDASSPPTLRSGATANDADNVLIWNGSAWDTYFWTGTIWRRTGGADRTHTPIYPDDGVFVVHKDTAAAATITMLGTVPSTAEKSDIYANGSTFLANRFPTDTTLGGLGLHLLPAWVAGNTAAASDNVLLWNEATGAWDTYFWTGTVGTPNNIWKRTGTTDRSSTPIPAGTSVFLTHTGVLETLAQALPYTP